MWKAISKFRKLKCHKRNRHNCNEAFTIRFSINLHSWNCNICGKLFPNLIKSKCHKKYHHNCKKCGKGFESFSKLKCHKNIIPGLENLVKEAHVADVFEEAGEAGAWQGLKIIWKHEKFQKKAPSGWWKCVYCSCTCWPRCWTPKASPLQSPTCPEFRIIAMYVDSYFKILSNWNATKTSS